MPDFLALDVLPDAHPRTIVVRGISQGGGGTLATALANNTPLLNAVRPTGGLAALARLERDGGVTGAFPITVPAANGQNSLPRGAGTLFAVASQAQSDDPAAATVVTLATTVDVDRLLEDLNADDQVTYATRAPARYVAVAPPVTAAEPRRYRTADQTPKWLWNLERIRLPEAQAAGADDASAIRVGVLDTGVDPDHPALAAVLDSYVHGTSQTAAVSAQDIVGHGTHVAGTIASSPNTNLGARGVCNARMRVWKIFDDQPDLIPSGGIYWYLVDPVLYRSALADCIGKVDVLNLSIGGRQPPDPQEAALFRLLGEDGVTVVAAMGNERSMGSPTSYPAAIPGVIAVGATTPADDVAAFSNAGNHIALAAPGTGIWSTLPTYPGQVGFRATRANGQSSLGPAFPRDTSYAALDGTSMAAPQVAAAAALALSNSPHGRTPQEIHDLLMVTARRLAPMGQTRWSPDFGAGLLNLQRLVYAAQRL